MDTEKEKANLTKTASISAKRQPRFYDLQKLIRSTRPTSEEPRLLCIGRTERGILTFASPIAAKPFDYRPG